MNTNQMLRLPMTWRPVSPGEWLLEVLTLGVLLWWFSFLAIAEYPRSSTYASPLWLLPIVGLAVYASLSLLSRFPNLKRFPSHLTQAQATKLYLVRRWLLQLVKFELIASFAFLQWKMIETARGNAEGLDHWFAPVLVAVVSATSLYGAWQTRRAVSAS